MSVSVPSKKVFFTNYENSVSTCKDGTKDNWKKTMKCKNSYLHIRMEQCTKNEGAGKTYTNPLTKTTIQTTRKVLSVTQKLSLPLYVFKE